MTADTPSSNDTHGTPPHPSAEGRIFVLISIVIVAVMLVGMVGLLYWHERPAPSALLVLRVPAAQDGAIATIDSKYARDLSPIITTLHGGEEVRIPLPPGEYIVKIDHPTKRIRAECILSDYSYFPIVLGENPTTGPATRSNSKR